MTSACPPFHPAVLSAVAANWLALSQRQRNKVVWQWFTGELCAGCLCACYSNPSSWRVGEVQNTWPRMRLIWYRFADYWKHMQGWRVSF